MKYIRIHNDIPFRWRFYARGEETPIEYNLEGRNLKMVITSPFGREYLPVVLVSGNAATFKFPGKEHQDLGEYTLTMYENFGVDGMKAIDKISPFCLVGEQETVIKTVQGACEYPTLDIDVLELSSELEFAGGGAGTYADLPDKPSINGVTIVGNKTGEELGLTHPYLSLERIKPYLYRITFDALPEDGGGGVLAGACSAFVLNGILYRNLDYFYDNAASFIVKTRDFEGMSFITGLNDGELNDELISQLPYRIVDGRNNNGIMASVHVLFNDWGWTGSGNRSISLTRLPFEVLSRVKSMSTIASDLSGVLGNLYASEGVRESGYLLQMLITDGTTTYALIPPTSEGAGYVLVNATANPKMSNFRWVSRSTVSRADSDLQTRPTGIERWNMMPCPLEDLRFTLAYEGSDRLSEFIGLRGTTKASSDAQLLPIYQEAREEYLERERDGKTWHTMHSVVYGGSKMLELCIQEDWENNIIASGGVSKEYVDAEIARVEAEIPDISELATLTQLQAVADSIPTKVSDLNNDSGFQTASQVSAAVGTETARAQAAEALLNTGKVDKIAGKGLSTNDYTTTEKQKLAGLENYDDTAINARAAALEGQVNRVVLDGMSASADGSTVTLALTKVNIKTGATSSVDVPLPVVDADGAGILNPQTYQTIINNQTLVNAIIGASVAVSGLAAEPTQAQVTNAWLTASGLEELVNGARLFDVTNTKVWTYYTNTELWYPVEAEGGGSVVIAQWTNSALGTVKGVADNASHTNDGKLTAETDGTGSVLGWDRLIARVQTIEGKEDGWDAKYDKPSAGIPSTDMTTEVQTTLDKVTTLESNQGDLSELETTEQSSLVGAINEVKNDIPSPVTIATTITPQSTNTDAAGAAAVYAAATTPIVAGEQTAVTVAMDCGKKYKYMDASGIASLAFTLNAPADNAVATIWYLKFRSGATATNVSFPSGLWYPNGAQPSIEANTIYEIMIDEDYCLTMQAYKQLSA